MNRLLLDALKCNNRSRPPVWLMRQAGRYMPEYRKLREKYSFLEMCHQPELVVEITQLPIRAFGMDAAILFSDILVVPEAMGVGLRFEEGKGPIIERPVEDIEALPKINIEEKLEYVGEGIKQLLQELQVPLIGFAGGPFTVASYMIEGGSTRDFRKTKQWMLHQPENFHRLLDLLTSHTISYLNMQIERGVHALQIFDSWANVLAYAQFKEFSLAYLHKILRGIKKDIPVILFCRGSSVFAPLLAEVGPAAISIDLNADMKELRKRIPSHIALQGNLDPDILYAPLAVIKREVGRMLESMHQQPGYIFNLGHGVHPDVPVEAVRTLVEKVQNSR